MACRVTDVGKLLLSLPIITGFALVALYTRYKGVRIKLGD